MTLPAAIFKSDESGAELVNFARQTAERLVKDGLTRAQIRNIFTEVRRIEALWEIDPAAALRRLNMLKPKLDYQTARAKEVAYLRDVLIPAIEQVNSGSDKNEKDRRFQRFMDLFEGILAYHRALGGRN